MSARTKITIAAIAAVIILDTGASLISRFAHTPYADFSFRFRSNSACPRLLHLEE